MNTLRYYSVSQSDTRLISECMEKKITKQPWTLIHPALSASKDLTVLYVPGVWGDKAISF